MILITYLMGLFKAFPTLCAAQLSTIAPWKPAGALPLLSASFLALLLARPTAPDFSESHGSFRDVFLLSRFLFDPPEASGRKWGAFCPDAIQQARRARVVRDAEATAKRREP